LSDIITSQQSVRVSAKRPGLAETNARRWFWLVVLVLVLLAVALASLMIGSRDIGARTALDALFAYDDSDEHAIVRALRLPRTILGVGVGVALGMAGALMQALTRNPLADPGLLGVNAGAYFAVVLGVSLFGLSGIGSYIWFALAGAIVTTIVVYVVGVAGRFSGTPVRLTLAGVAIGAVLSGVSAGITLLDPTSFDRLRQWSAGSLVGQNDAGFLVIFLLIACGLLAAFLVARQLNAIALGDDLARAVGVSVKRTRVVVIAATTLLAGAATAAAGPIGFVGLMVPHLARWIGGTDQRWIFAYTMVLGPILLLVADIAGRLVMRPAELQVGIVTAFIGAPVLIALARRRKVSGL